MSARCGEGRRGRGCVHPYTWEQLSGQQPLPSEPITTPAAVRHMVGERSTAARPDTHGRRWSS